MQDGAEIKVEIRLTHQPEVTPAWKRMWDYLLELDPEEDEAKEK